MQDVKVGYLDIRHQSVVKSNDLIQKSRFNLSLQQQKIILYLISKIRPEDEEFQLYEFDIQEFCRVCGIDEANGKNYKLLKDSIQGIRDKSCWVTLPNGNHSLIAWIEKARILENSGTIEIKLDNDMKPYLLKLKENYTQYELIWTLHFRSKYTIRLYELCKSIHYHELEEYSRTYTLDELRQLFGAETYKTFQHFKDRVLVPSINEINEYSDKFLEFKPIKQKKKVVGIQLVIHSKSTLETLKIQSEIDKEMGIPPGQMTLWDEIKSKQSIHEG